MARNQRHVLAGMDRMTARRLGRIAKRYNRETLGPLVAAIKGADGLKDMQRRLGAGLFRKMKTGALEEAMDATLAQADGIGRVAAEPKETSKRRNVETSKRLRADS